MANQLAPLITFKSAVAQRSDNFDMAEEAADRIHQPNFTQEETDILVWEVRARTDWIYGSASRPPPD